ncbi:MAG: TRAP transporter small permease [Pikeienuella sp.]
MMLQIVADVLAKNLFSAPLPLTSIFVANYYMVFAAFAPLALAEKLNRHIAVELVWKNLAERPRRVVAAIACLASGIVCAGVAWQLWGEAMKKFRAGTLIVEQSVSMPTWPGYFVLPTGFGLLAAILFYRFATLTTGLAGGMGETPLDGDEPQFEQV